MDIEHLYLYTGHLAQQTSFYKNVLGLPIVERTYRSVTFKVGRSLITWSFRSGVEPYHFAFNIPFDQIIDASGWLKERLNILTYKGREIHDFAAWQARAVYFYDADGNIVEFIARRDIMEMSKGSFSCDSILSISEIGVSTDNISSIAEILKKIYGLQIFSGNYHRFCALGNHQGLFIIVDRNLKKWFPTDEVAFIEDFEATCSVDEVSRTIEYKKGILKIKKDGDACVGCG